MALEPTHPSLLSRLRDPADDAAWRQFEQTYTDLIVRFCRRQGLQAADAEDVRQIVLVKLVRSMPRFVYDRGRGRFRDYLFRTVRSAMVDLARKRASAPAACPEPAGGPVSEEGDPLRTRWQREWEDHHLRLAMAKARQGADPRSVEIFERLLAGEPVGQVARQMHMSEAATHKVKQRMRDRLKVLIAEQIAEEDRLEEPE